MHTVCHRVELRLEWKPLAKVLRLRKFILVVVLRGCLTIRVVESAPEASDLSLAYPSSSLWILNRENAWGWCCISIVSVRNRGRLWGFIDCWNIAVFSGWDCLNVVIWRNECLFLSLIKRWFDSDEVYVHKISG